MRCVVRIQYPSSGNRNTLQTQQLVPLFIALGELLLFTKMDWIVWEHRDIKCNNAKMKLLQLYLLKCVAMQAFYNQNIHLDIPLYLMFILHSGSLSLSIIMYMRYVDYA